MATIYPTLPKLSVKESFDDDNLTDVDDEVFIRDGKNGSYKLDDDGSVKRPLMAPRRKCKKSTTFETRKLSYRVLALSACYGLIALVVLIGLIALCIFTVNMFPMPLNIMKNWPFVTPEIPKNTSHIIPCTSLDSRVLWTKTISKIIPAASLRSIDVNDDKIYDIIIGFSTDTNNIASPEYICNLYFGGQSPCMGGVLAIDGSSGEVIWTHWTANAVTSIDCNLDLTADKINDCVISGNGGILHVINGKDGTTIWKFPTQNIQMNDIEILFDKYNAKFTIDVDKDGLEDIIAAHVIKTITGNEESYSSQILILSGKSGNVLRNIKLPDSKQLYIAPTNLIHPDGENYLIFITSSHKQSGGLYVISQTDIINNKMKLRKLYNDTASGELISPILADINSDGTEDIISVMSKSTIIAYNGITFKPIWNYTIPNSEIISLPIPGYYNDDNVPDFMIKYRIILDDAEYYYTATTIIDGKNGEEIMEKPMMNSLNKQMSGLSITVDDFGNDWFLYWSTTCSGKNDINTDIPLIEEKYFSTQSYDEICKKKFNVSSVNHLLALSQHVGPPGISIHFSEDWEQLELNDSADSIIELHRTKSVPSFKYSAPYTKNVDRKNHHKEFFKHKGNGILSGLDNYQPKQIENSYTNNANDEYSKIVNTNMQTNNFNDFPLNNWERTNKWLEKNSELEKDYDVPYDTSNDNNEDEERNVDYLQPEEIREQRSSNESSNALLSSYKNNERSESTLNNSQFNVTSEMQNSTKLNRSDVPSIYIKEKQKESSLLTQPSIRERNISDILNDDNVTDIQKIFVLASLKNRYDKSEKFADARSRIKRTKRESTSRDEQTQRTVKQRLTPPTGILLPSLTQSTSVTSVDLIIPTMWAPSRISNILLEKELNCIRRKLAFSDMNNRYNENDVISECLSERDDEFGANLLQELMDRENIKATFGQMTIYRIKLECVCPEDMLPNQSCKNISAMQSWPEQMGPSGNGYFQTMLKSQT